MFLKFFLGLPSQEQSDNCFSTFVMKRTNISQKGGIAARAALVISPSLSQNLLNRSWIESISSAATEELPGLDSESKSGDRESFDIIRHSCRNAIGGKEAQRECQRFGCAKNEKADAKRQRSNPPILIKFPFLSFIVMFERSSIVLEHTLLYTLLPRFYVETCSSL